MSIMQIQPGRVPATQFGDRLRLVRREANLTMKDMSAYLGSTETAYSQWETNRRLPKNMRSVCLSLQLLTGIDANWLLTGEVPQTNPPDGPDGLPHLDSNQEPCETWLRNRGRVPDECPQKAA